MINAALNKIILPTLTCMKLGRSSDIELNNYLHVFLISLDNGHYRTK